MINRRKKKKSQRETKLAPRFSSVKIITPLGQNKMLENYLTLSVDKITKELSRCLCNYEFLSTKNDEHNSTQNDHKFTHAITDSTITVTIGTL